VRFSGICASPRRKPQETARLDVWLLAEPDLPSGFRHVRLVEIVRAGDGRLSIEAQMREAAERSTSRAMAAGERIPADDRKSHSA